MHVNCVLKILLQSNIRLKMYYRGCQEGRKMVVATAELPVSI